MNRVARNIIMDRARNGGRSNYRGNLGGSRNGDYGGEYWAGMEGDYAYGDPMGRRDYPYERDGRRGVKGTGPYGIGGRLHYGRDRDRMDYCHEDDYERENRGGRDYGESAHLSRKDMTEWKRHLENADGSLGEHFSGEQIKNMAEKLNIRYKGYDEKELCMTVNMLYSDYCEALRGVIPPEKELMVYTKMAKAFLDDDDFNGDGSEKLALYYYCIADSEEE